MADDKQKKNLRSSSVGKVDLGWEDLNPALLEDSTDVYMEFSTQKSKEKCDKTPVMASQLTKSKIASTLASPLPSTSGSKLHAGQRSSKKSSRDSSTHSTGNTEIIKILKDIQEKQGEQAARLVTLENQSYYDEEEYDEQYELETDEESYIDPSQNHPGHKRKLGSSPSKDDYGGDTENRFSLMSKRFKPSDSVVDKNVDVVLANNVNELFKNGMSEDQYNALTKDEVTARPKNCDGLVLVKTNQLVWDIMTPESRSSDRKMQAIESSVIKSAIILSKAVDSLADLADTSNLPSTAIPDVIDKLNDSLALLGHSNRQINLTRRDFIKADLRPEFSHLLHSHSLSPLFYLEMMCLS
ncbi:uncharacterized protein LOC126811206 isoform X2 [Patella vulgata]|uniref:uncharacterized protein LOC126811206 isoform X2 n=1 Tax=Patella vulgata TaxID=6465 RepID=UPI0024A92C2E|nr:uncharacterized protein LOC126811206 isoform X2 [Patella vulgata]